MRDVLVKTTCPFQLHFIRISPTHFWDSAKRTFTSRACFLLCYQTCLTTVAQAEQKKVRFAKFLRTPLEAEDRFLSENVNEYDFTFPIHAPAGSRSFRDHPFIPLVRVPSVVFLAYDGNERTSKTHAIATTILKAWPIMVFILLSATFSGIIIWFLVSANAGKIFLK